MEGLIILSKSPTPTIRAEISNGNPVSTSPVGGVLESSSRCSLPQLSSKNVCVVKPWDGWADEWKVCAVPTAAVRESHEFIELKQCILERVSPWAELSQGGLHSSLSPRASLSLPFKAFLLCPLSSGPVSSSLDSAMLAKSFSLCISLDHSSETLSPP